MNVSLTKVGFSIGAKLITIITLIVLVSVGLIIALVSWLDWQYLRVLAEETNIEVNRRSAMEAEYTIGKMSSDSLLLIRSLTAPGTENSVAEETIAFFFEQNPLIAALIFTVPGQADRILTNDSFFSQETGAALADSFPEAHKTALRQAVAGETVILNAAPWLNTALVALYFRWPRGGGMVLFSPENFNDSFTLGPNKSYLINDAGDILYHAEYRLVQEGENVGRLSFTRNLWENRERNAQTLDTDEEGVRYFRAFYKLNIAGATVITSIEYDKVFEGIAAHTRSIIELSAAVLFISILSIWFFAKSISIPLKTLAAAAHTIEGGVFDLQLEPKGRDEVSVLTSSFQRMCAALGIFGRFTNRDIALGAMRGEIKPGGLPKHATIFFSDIREFTAKSEGFTHTFGDDASDRIVHWLNEYFTKMIECVEKTGGVVDKFIGDAVMAHWGTAYTAGSPKKDAHNCILAALMMRKALFDMNKNRKPDDPGNPYIRIGCGINTGIVTAGQLGSELRMEYTAIGDAVNLASRTEALNKPLGTDILITEDTWRLVKEYFITEEMPSVTVKGKEKPVRIFAVVNSVIVDKGPKTLAEVRKLLGLETPDISKIDVNADERKYKIGDDA
ncbi:MAG: HAMP domain-containing protein [Treponema sp.]|nr:HAMP domain-containing protein [Treponema sp.]